MKLSMGFGGKNARPQGGQDAQTLTLSVFALSWSTVGVKWEQTQAGTERACKTLCR